MCQTDVIAREFTSILSQPIESHPEQQCLVSGVTLFALFIASVYQCVRYFQKEVK